MLSLARKLTPSLFWTCLEIWYWQSAHAFNADPPVRGSVLLRHEASFNKSGKRAHQKSVEWMATQRDPQNEVQYKCSTGSTYDTYNAATLTAYQKQQVERLWPGKPASYYACNQGCGGHCSSTGGRSRCCAVWAAPTPPPTPRPTPKPSPAPTRATQQPTPEPTPEPTVRELSAKENTEFECTFKKYDTNADWNITWTEAEPRGLTQEQFGKMDVTGDGGITKTDYAIANDDANATGTVLDDAWVKCDSEGGAFRSVRVSGVSVVVFVLLGWAI